MKDLKASYYVSASRYKNAETPERTTERYEFELCTKGESYTVMDGKKIWRAPGMLILAKPGQRRFSIGHFECYYIHFNLDADDILVRKIAQLPDTYIPSQPHRINDIFYAACGRIFSNPENEDYFIKGAIMQLVADITEQLYPLGISYIGKYEHYTGEVTSAKQYIDTNYGTKLNLKIISEQVNLSANFFRIVFKDIMGMSPHEYLLKIRIKKAKEYLINTDLPISQIALLCGFDTQSNLTGIFTKTQGTTPYKYRKNKREKL